jgi:DNA-binding LacI/PurR family transcriptional regulator
LVTTGNFRLGAAEAATAALLRDQPGLTALVIANNLMTIGALRALRQRELRVPDDVALVAIDDPFWAELVDPPLTTLAQPVRTMAETAMELLTGRIREPTSDIRHMIYPFALRVRQSCGMKQTSLPGDDAIREHDAI